MKIPEERPYERISFIMSPSKYKEYGQNEANHQVSKFQGRDIGYDKNVSRSNSLGNLVKNQNLVNVKGAASFSKDFKGRTKYLG